MSPLHLANAAPHCTAPPERTGQPRLVRIGACVAAMAPASVKKPGRPHPSWKHGTRSRECTEPGGEINDSTLAEGDMEVLIGWTPRTGG